MKLYYLGPEGTHSHDAAVQLRDALLAQADLIPCTTIPLVIEQTSSVQAENALCCVPIENSIQGSVAQTWDTLMKSACRASDGGDGEPISILAAFTVPIHHYAIHRKGISYKDVQQVYSHPQALAQCQQHIASLFPKAVPVALTSTAEAVRQMAEGGGTGSQHDAAVAIAGRNAAARYGLERSSSPIEDQAGNETRFALVGTPGGLSPCVGTPQGWRLSERMVSLCLHGVTHSPGGLVGALLPFAEADLNLGRVESRPVGDRLGNYVFYLDVSFDASASPSEMGSCLAPVTRQLASSGIDVVALGSYPVYQVES
ncbi:prephenate dehydratase [Alicyclobacillus fastidiosus]|uniref:prephenate dehydratase n=1 Tax=Alicyclobacillus fastidiosus TaxID=392011 RepID=A0ABY6ZBF4_9BACL|nr:prephenate dehydratase [Alicyclobacillus fastidiosus]WAH40179.1 prephenate dehydratase [Alicyclobacillus fastidiosus]GMA61528.1 prephenate dehydratase [Alicyclobacillus fastidiosus]